MILFMNSKDMFGGIFYPLLEKSDPESFESLKNIFLIQE